MIIRLQVPPDVKSFRILHLENCEEMSELAERKKKETVPVIKKAFTSATDSLQECLELEELISSWYVTFFMIIHSLLLLYSFFFPI